MKDKCKHCGACCYWQDGDKRVKCPHLKVITPIKCFCRTYKSLDRIGLKIGEFENGAHIFCAPRNASSQGNFKGCPYNVYQREEIFNF